MNDDIKAIVRDRYAKVAEGVRGGEVLVTADHPASDCCGSGSSCCGNKTNSTSFGYGIDELKALPDGADLGLGCGNPTALASISEGETVVDLGSGAGIDCFLAARRVGEAGRVIGVDMTPQMLERARANARSGGYANVEFRMGEIEHLPVADGEADLIISNCVVNLSPDKPQVFREAFRALKSGGRLSVSDIVLTEELAPEHKTNAALLTGCVSGASLQSEYLGAMKAAGFTVIRIKSSSATLKTDHIASLAAEAGVSESDAAHIAMVARSITVSARKQ
jgi:ubiquinone/menaquinone biosynthesis C-methylase UbiE